jgi:hypothetical protein
MPDPLGLITQALYTRLSSTTIGFNQAYMAIQPTYVDYSTSLAVPAWTVDWTPTSSNFVYGMVQPDLIEETSPLNYPILTISADAAIADRPGTKDRVIYQTFTGKVRGTVQVILSWTEQQTRDFESWPNAVSAAMYSVINNLSQQSWGAGIVYTADMDAQKNPVILAGTDWRRQILFPMSFRVLIA